MPSSLKRRGKKNDKRNLQQQLATEKQVTDEYSNWLLVDLLYSAVVVSAFVLFPDDALGGEIII